MMLCHHVDAHMALVRLLQVAPQLPLLGGSGPRLTAATRTTVTTDLNRPGWDQQLLAAGFNPARPTVWVAEGLVYYLQPEAAKELLQVRGLGMPAAVLVFVTQGGVTGRIICCSMPKSCHSHDRHMETDACAAADGDHQTMF
jgi:O-methyltransferase involved in polyketide biosynthesis